MSGYGVRGHDPGTGAAGKHPQQTKRHTHNHTTENSQPTTPHTKGWVFWLVLVVGWVGDVGCRPPGWGKV